MSEHIHKSHNKTVLLYHMVFPSKYRRKVFSKEIEKTLIETCIEISERYEINFVEIGNDEDHPEIKKKLWGGNLWTRGFYANTVGQYGSEAMIKEYVKNQGKQYTQVHKGQLKFEL